MNPVLKTFFPIADLIAGTFGPNCEVAVHDLEQPDQSVVYVANGSVTGRKEGQSFDHLIRNVLLNNRFEDDRVINYTFQTGEKTIRSSSALIRDSENKVVGMICINYDLSPYLQVKQNLDAFLFSEGDTEMVEDPDKTVMEVIDQLILKIIGDANVSELPRKRLIELVRFMDEKGVFLVKGAMDKVAELMGISKVTLYSYLDEAKGRKEKNAGN